MGAGGKDGRGRREGERREKGSKGTNEARKKGGSGEEGRDVEGQDLVQAGSQALPTHCRTTTRLAALGKRTGPGPSRARRELTTGLPLGGLAGPASAS